MHEILNYIEKRPKKIGMERAVSKLMALDLFAGGGGACIGMQWAGFEVVGVDIEMHRNYPGHFIQGDIHDLPVDVMDFDFVWSSPPCQAHSFASKFGDNDWERHPDLIPITRKILKGHPYSVIENVPGAPLRHNVVLTGKSVGMQRLDRRRHFECSFMMFCPKPERQEKWKWTLGIAGTITKSMCSSSHFYHRKANGLPGRIPNHVAKGIMGIPVIYPMTNAEIGEAVAPPMAHRIAREARRQIELEAA